jgi:hypothetical protein
MDIGFDEPAPDHFTITSAVTVTPHAARFHDLVILVIHSEALGQYPQNDIATGYQGCLGGEEKAWSRHRDQTIFFNGLVPFCEHFVPRSCLLSPSKGPF